MKVQRIARTFPHGYPNEISNLEDLLNDGYTVVMCNRFETQDRQTGIEYIVEKEERCGEPSLKAGGRDTGIARNR